MAVAGGFTFRYWMSFALIFGQTRLVCVKSAFAQSCRGSALILTPQSRWVQRGIGTPNGTLVGSPGDLYVDLTGGAGVTFYVKESGSATNTGWVSK